MRPIASAAAVAHAAWTGIRYLASVWMPNAGAIRTAVSVGMTMASAPIDARRAATHAGALVDQ